MKKFFICFSLLCFFVFSGYSQVSCDYGPQLKDASPQLLEYIPGVVIFKVKEDYRHFCKKSEINLPALNSVFNRFKQVDIHKKFPLHQPPTQKVNSYGLHYVDLSLIYEYHYSSKIPINKVIQAILKTGMVKYAEPHYIPRLLYAPNDPFADTAGNFRQFGLINTHLFEGWDISKGDSTVVVGIVDTGTDTDHGDLMDNIAYNTLDTIDGIDNDNDGFIDNYYGWDLGENDNDPNVNTIVHGSHVSGISSATTDNNVGIAGSGFKCRFLPVKIDDENGILSMSYEGIVYAADHGCDIINCSWGGTFGNGNFGQEIINYATINKDALVFGACGNDDNQDVFYPASYNYVISVAATDIDDLKYLSENGNGSNYNIFVDLSAPGKSIYSTLSSNTYAYSSGTSMAAPFAAGIAAIVKSHFPEMNAIQVGEQLRVTADNIDTVSGNQMYSGLLGKGRVNLYRALTETQWPSIRLLGISPEEDFFYQLKPGDSFEINGEFINYLDTVAGLSVSLSCDHENVTITDSVFTPNVVNSLESFSNETDPFQITIEEGVPVNEEIVFRLNYTNGIYNDFEYFTIIVNADFLNIETNRIKASVSSAGRLVYHGEYTPLDLGFLYDNEENILFCGGLMLGNASNRVSDNVYGGDIPFDEDFATKDPIHFIEQPQIADMESASKFNDSLNVFNSLDVEVLQQTYSWQNSPNDRFVVIEYAIVNQGFNDLYPLYAGFFADWDIDEATKNKANIDVNRKLAYVFPAGGGVHCGIKLLNSGAFHHYAIDNDGNGGAINFYDLNGFSTYEKFLSLTNDRAEAGALETGNDVSHLISSGPFNLGVGDTVEVAFALIAGDYLEDLKNSADIAQQIYSNLIQLPEVTDQNTLNVEIVPNPVENWFQIQITNHEVLNVEIMDAKGSPVVIPYEKREKFFRFDAHSLKSGYYLLKIVTANGIFMKKFIKQ